MNSKKNDYAVRVATRTGRMTQEPLYPEGHPKRIEQDSQRNNIDVPSYSGSSGGASNSTTSDGGFSNTAFSVMPAYEIAYCWKRTA